MVATTSDHQETIVDYYLSHAEVFGLISDNMDTKFRERHTSPSDIETINRHPPDHREEHMGEDEDPITFENIAMNVSNDKKDEVRAMLNKNERSWSGKLGEVNVPEMHIYLPPDSKPLQSPPFRDNESRTRTSGN